MPAQECVELDELIREVGGGCNANSVDGLGGERLAARGDVHGELRGCDSAHGEDERREDGNDERCRRDGSEGVLDDEIDEALHHWWQSSLLSVPGGKVLAELVEALAR